MEDANEQWLPIPDWEGYYDVSDHGRVRSVPRVVMSGGFPRRRTGRILKTRKNKHGYWQISLYRDGGSRCVSVHKLVLEAFVGPRPDGMQGCHGDGDQDNNTLPNLRWDTRAENTLDTIRHGTNHAVNTTHCPKRHEYTADNTRLNAGKRICKTCHRDRERGRPRRKVAA